MKYIRLLQPFAGAIPRTIMTIPDDSVEDVVRLGIVEIVSQKVADGENDTDPEPTPESPPDKKKKKTK